MALQSERKRRHAEDLGDLSTSKRQKVLLANDSSDESEDQETHGGVSVGESGAHGKNEILKINEEFATRFEHNKKREELHRHKYGESSRRSGANGQKDHDEDSSSSSESSEDDDGMLVSEAVDIEIQDTLEAIRRKDPRIYDKATIFYKPTGPQDEKIKTTKSRETTMHLKDYHRMNLLGKYDKPKEAQMPSESYVEQQADLKKSLIKEFHEAEPDSALENGNVDQDDEEFLVTKPSNERLVGHNHPPVLGGIEELDVANAEKDPDGFLSNLMSSRAWAHTDAPRFQPFESDDEEDERKAEEFEEAFNLRFEDPAKANEKLVSHARDVAEKLSVRKASKNVRQRARELERERGVLEKERKAEEKARLRKLKTGEAELRIQKIKEAAGQTGKSFDETDWVKFLEDGWDNEEWEEGMRHNFGDEYYSRTENEDSAGANSLTKNRLRKPKWKDDIDISDLVPDFVADGDQAYDDASRDEDPHTDGGHTTEMHAKKTSSKGRSRLERRQIQEVVDRKLDADDVLNRFGKKHTGGFRYRDTSPMAFGLSPRDILMASDSQLNQYAGLKKLAAFREPDKKSRDLKKLGKKARLKQWRRETFGHEDGPSEEWKESANGAGPASSKETIVSGIATEKQKKKRRRRAARSTEVH